ncbi:MAG TPA: aldolase, partial [Streptomyces sp.]|nr:aldolase [Streptomyces sp.]
AAYTGQFSADGAVMDEPATARALSNYLLRGLDCGALTSGEVARHSGMTRADLDRLAGRTPAPQAGSAP